MNYTDFMYALGDGILWTTDVIFDNVGNLINYAFIALIMGGMAYWVSLMFKYNKRAKGNPDYKE